MGRGALDGRAEGWVVMALGGGAEGWVVMALDGRAEGWECRGVGVQAVCSIAVYV